MSISYDNSAQYTNGSGTGTSHSFSFTVGTGANRVLFVSFMHFTDSTDVVSSVSYAGQSMSRVSSVASAGGLGRGYVYMLPTPASGNNSVQITLSASRSVFGAASSYAGASSSATVDASNTNTTASGTSLSASVTTTANITWLMSALFDFAGRTITASTNTTARSTASASGGTTVGDSNTDETPAGSFSQAYNISGGGDAAIIVASFAPGRNVGGLIFFI